MVTAAEAKGVRMDGKGAARQRATAGQIAMVTAPSATQARCCGDGPLTGSGETAMPMPDMPAMASRTRAGARIAVRPAAVRR